MEFEPPPRQRLSQVFPIIGSKPFCIPEKSSFELKEIDPKRRFILPKPVDPPAPSSHPLPEQALTAAQADAQTCAFWYYCQKFKTWGVSLFTKLRELHCRGFTYEPDFSSCRQKASYWMSLSLTAILFVVSIIFTVIHFTNEWYIAASPKVRVLDLVLVTLSFTTIHLFHLIWYPPMKRRPTDSKWFRWVSFAIFLLGWAAFFIFSVLSIYLWGQQDEKWSLDANKAFIVASSIMLRLAVTIFLFPATNPPGGRKYVRNALLFYLLILAIVGIVAIIIMLLEWNPADAASKLGVILIVLGLEVEVMSLIDRLRQTPINEEPDLENQLAGVAKSTGSRHPHLAVFADIAPAGGLLGGIAEMGGL